MYSGTQDYSDVFPRARRYAALTAAVRPGIAAEERAAWQAFHYTERHLQCVWADSSIRPRQLLSAAGEEVDVLSPGEWNLEAGPDFLDAVLVIGPHRRRVTGDVEQFAFRGGHGYRGGG